MPRIANLGVIVRRLNPASCITHSRSLERLPLPVPPRSDQRSTQSLADHGGKGERHRRYAKARDAKEQVSAIDYETPRTTSRGNSRAIVGRTREKKGDGKKERGTKDACEALCYRVLQLRAHLETLPNDHGAFRRRVRAPPPRSP